MVDGKVFIASVSTVCFDTKPKVIEPIIDSA
jgi:hypothetical protein